MCDAVAPIGNFPDVVGEIFTKKSDAIGQICYSCKKLIICVYLHGFTTRQEDITRFSIKRD